MPAVLTHIDRTAGGHGGLEEADEDEEEDKRRRNFDLKNDRQSAQLLIMGNDPTECHSYKGVPGLSNGNTHPSHCCESRRGKRACCRAQNTKVHSESL